MYKVKVVGVNEIMEIEVEAKYCLLDQTNNLVFVNKVEEITQPIAMFPAGRWVAVEQG